MPAGRLDARSSPRPRRERQSRACRDISCGHAARRSPEQQALRPSLMPHCARGLPFAGRQGVALLPFLQTDAEPSLRRAPKESERRARLALVVVSRPTAFDPESQSGGGFEPPLLAELPCRHCGSRTRDLQVLCSVLFQLSYLANNPGDVPTLLAERAQRTACVAPRTPPADRRGCIVL